MKKAPPVRLSLRKILIAMAAVGPMAILPSPLLAAVPASAPFTVVNGGSAVTWTVSGTTATINATIDRAILNWNTGGFNIAAGETYSFKSPGGSASAAILNRVGYNGVADTAIINGSLISQGRIFILANGSISIGQNASISAPSLTLSTLSETDNVTFMATGNLALSGAPTSGTITIGGGAAATNLNGDVVIAGSVASLDNVLVSGNLAVHQRGAQTNFLTGSNGATQVNGNLAVTTSNTAIAQVGTGGLVVSGNTVINTGNAAVSLTTPTNNFSTVNATAGALTLNDIDSVVLGNSTVSSVAVTAVNNITTNGSLTVTSGAPISFTSTGVGNVTFNATSAVAGVVSASAAGGTVAITTPGALTLGTLTGANGVTVTNSGSVALQGTVSSTVAGSNVTISGTTINSTAAGSVVTPLYANLTATAGTVVLPSVAANAANVSAVSGISQASSTYLTLTPTVGAASVFNAGTGAVNLNNVAGATSNRFNNAVIQLTGSSATVSSNTAVTIGNSEILSNLVVNTGASAIAGGAVTLGSGLGSAGQDINVGGSLTITTNGSDVTDIAATVSNIYGSTTINTWNGSTTTPVGTSTVSLTAAALGQTGGGRWGQFTVYAGTVSLHESSSLNIGAIGATGAVTLNSTAGDILISGLINAGSLTANANSGNITEVGGGLVNLTGTANLRTSSTANYGVNLSNAGNSLIGAVTVTNGNNNIIVASSAITLASGSSVTGSGSRTNITSTNNNVLVSGGNMANTTVTGSTVTVAGGTFNTLALYGTNATTSITQTAAVTVNNSLTVGGLGTVTLNTVSNNLSNLTFNGTVGPAAVYSARNLNVSGSAFGDVEVASGTATSATSVGTYANTWALVLGNLNVGGNLTAKAYNGASNLVGAGNTTAGSSGTISQTSSGRLHVEGTASFTTLNNNIVLANNGNSFARVNANTGGAAGGIGSFGAITLVEDGSLRVGSLASFGAVSLTSRFGDILEDSNAASSITTGAGVLTTLSAPTGSVRLGNQTTTFTSNITAANITAANAALLASSADLTLGAVSANSLAVTANSISQSAASNVYGLASFTANGGNITLTNAANNFGPVALNVTAANANIAITEANTLNLRSVSLGTVSGNGTFTANSINGDIIDTLLGGVKLGGSNTGVASTGIVSLSALNGNITIDDPASDILTMAGVAFNAKNVTLSVVGGLTSFLVIGANNTASSVTGNLSVTSMLGHIQNAGSIQVGGLASFTARNGDIAVTQGTLGFGSLYFLGNRVYITEAGSMDILPSSGAYTLADLRSGGNISVLNATAGEKIIFGGSVRFQANGNITLQNMQVPNGTLTISHTGKADLSALSLSNDLAGRAIADEGTGTTVGPGN